MGSKHCTEKGECACGRNVVQNCWLRGGIVQRHARVVRAREHGDDGGESACGRGCAGGRGRSLPTLGSSPSARAGGLLPTLGSSPSALLSVALA